MSNFEFPSRITEGATDKLRGLKFAIRNPQFEILFLSMSERLDKAVVIGFLVALVGTALAQGAVEPWSVSLFELLVLILLLLWAIKAVVDKRLNLRVPA